MTILQTRRRFLTTLAFGRRRRLPAISAIHWRRSRRSRPRPYGWPSSPVICFAPQYVARGVAAGRGLYRYPLFDTDARGFRMPLDAANSTSPSISLCTSSPASTPARRSRSCRACMPAAMSCLRRTGHPRGRRSEGQKRRRRAERRRTCPDLMAAYVGLDPKNDIRWSPTPRSSLWNSSPRASSTPFWHFRREPQELHARRRRPCDLRTAVDRPWSQYFCCVLAGNREFVAQLSGRDETRDPRHAQGRRSVRQPSRKRVARLLVDGGFRRAMIMRCRR